MTYCINPESDEPIFCIFDQIGKDDEKPDAPYVDGNEFAKELLKIDGLGKKRIQIWINSEGGNVKEGYSIISAMLKTQTKVDVLVIGIAYSIMAIAALMGRKVEMMDFSSLMFHNPYNPDGTVDSGLEIIKQSLITAVASRTGKSESEVGSFMAATTFYTAEQAERSGFINEVIKCSDSNAPRKITVTATDTKSMKSFGASYFNKYLNRVLNIEQIVITKIKHMKTVAKALGLNEEASEGAIASEIVKLQNKKVSDEDKIKNLETSVKTAEDALAAFKKTKSEEEELAAKAKLEADDKAKVKEAEDKMKAKDAFKVTAKNKIESVIAAKELAITDKAIANYVDMAGDTEEGLTRVVETIELIPSIKKAANLEGFKAAADKTGIPMIETLGMDAKGAPIAGNTSAMISAINSYKFGK